MAEQTITVEAHSWEEARQQVQPQLRSGLTIWSESVTRQPTKNKIAATAPTAEKAFAQALERMPSAAVIQERKEVAAPRRRTVTVAARDDDEARALVRGELGQREVVEHTELKVPARTLWRFFLRLARFELTILQQALVEVTFRTPAQFEFVIGPRREYHLTGTWGGQGTSPGCFFELGDIASDSDGNIYVSDSGPVMDSKMAIVGRYSRVQKFDSDGNVLTVWDSYGEGDGQFLEAQGIAITPEGVVYVTDGRRACVQRLAPDGAFLAKWGSTGEKAGQFSGRQLHVAVASDESVYVSDRGNRRVQRFDREGTLLAAWDSDGAGVRFESPESIAVDSKGSVYVADAGRDLVLKFDASGQFLAQLGGRGEDEGQFPVPRGVAVDALDCLYVCAADARVHKFDEEGRFICRWGSYGYKRGQFLRAEGLTVDAEGSVYVVDGSTKLVHRFG